MTALPDLSMLEQAAAVRRGEVSPVELVDVHLARVEALTDVVGAFVTVTADAAREAARAAEARVRSTDDDRDLPPLLGVPTAVKDLNLTAGVPTRFGTVALAPVDVGLDDWVVHLMRRSGLISLGKTNTPEFGLPCYTEPDPSLAPPARTPWDLTRSAGGSSGGAAAAVAARLVPAAQGSDGGGSIRIPASVCGLVGVKPTRGRVSNAPMGNEISGLATNGPLARTVRDAAALLDAMAGQAPSDWVWPPPPTTSFLDACDLAPAAMRIGRYCTPVVVDTTLDAECLAAYDRVSELLASLGHEVVDHTPAFSPALVPAFEAVWATQAASAPVPPEAEQLLRPLTRWLRERGRSLSGQDYYGALHRLRMTARIELEATAAYDAVLTPTLAQLPALVGGLRDDADPAADFEAQKRFTPFTSPYNITGQPAVSLPLHWTDAGLPVGIQLVGRPGGEETLLRLAAQLEAAAPWAGRRPLLGVAS